MWVSLKTFEINSWIHLLRVCHDPITWKYHKIESKVVLPPYTHLWETWKKSSIHSVCPWGQVRVKVLSPNPQLLRLGQLLAKPRGVVPNKNTKAFKLSTRKWNLGVYCFIKPLTIKLKINMNIHSPRYIYIYNQINLHQKDTKKQLSGASFI